MNYNYDFTGKAEGDILLSYIASTGHRTRQNTKTTNLLALQEQKYSKFTDKTLISAVREMEKFTDRLTILAGYLQLHGLETGPTLAAEAGGFHKVTQER